MLRYKILEIMTSEAARCGRKTVVDAVLDYVRGLKTAARCMVTRGIAGCYENGELSSGKLEILSFNLPVRITIMLPEAETESVLKQLDTLVPEGILALQDMNVVFHRTRTSFFPRQLRVMDVMTRDPEAVLFDSSVRDAARLLLSSIFSGLPVVDTGRHPVGVITRGDLVRKAGLPLRPGLLAESDPDLREAVLNQLAGFRADEIMTAPAVVISGDRLLAEAVDRMLSKNLKRLPVVDDRNRLTGMLSRLDIFRMVMREAPDWQSFKAREIEVGNLKYVRDILRRDVHRVSPRTPVHEVIRFIDANDIQRVAVVDENEKLLGVISDRDLLVYFKPREQGIWQMLAKAALPFKSDPCRDNMFQCLSETTAEMVMTKVLITVQDGMLIEEAISLMLEKSLKRLPVVDAQGVFKGMISRDSLLRTGFEASTAKGDKP